MTLLRPDYRDVAGDSARVVRPLMRHGRRPLLQPEPVAPPLKVRLWSDLHLEMYSNTSLAEMMPEATDAGLVLLAGDVAQGANGVRWAARLFPGVPVAYVLGNHEFYGGDIVETLAAARLAAVGTRVRVLEQEAWDVSPGLRLLGTTLWTDYELWGASKAEAAMREGIALNDFRHITFQGRRFTPADALHLHREARAWLDRELARAAQDEVRAIVLTHHAPHRSCIRFAYIAVQDELSPSFASDLGNLMAGPTAPTVWCSGHTHANFRGQIARTMLLSNQAGYLYRGECADYVADGLLVEVSGI